MADNDMQQLRDILLNEISGTAPGEQDTEICQDLAHKDFKDISEMLEHFIKYDKLKGKCKKFIEQYNGLLLVNCDSEQKVEEFPKELVDTLTMQMKGKDTGVFKLNLPYDYYNVKRLVYYITDKTDVKMPMFFITPSTKIKGKIVSTILPTKQTVPLCTQKTFSRNLKGETMYYDMYNFIDDSAELKGRKSIAIKEATADYYFYSFLDNNGKQYTLLSQEKVASQIVEITGLLIKTNKSIELEGTKLAGKLPILIAYDIKSSLKELTDEEVNAFVKKYSIEDIFNYIFDKYRHPDFFERMILIWLLSGKWSGYPLHFFWVAANGSGKSTTLKNLKRALGETPKVFDGTSSTIKGLVPSFSFKGQPQPGAFLSYSRVALIDEFLRVLISSKRNDERAEELGKLNSILEHQTDFESFSANGSVEIMPTSKAIFSTNPLGGTKDISSLCKRYEEPAFWARIMTFFQPNSHLQWIREKKDYILANEVKTKNIELYDWLNFYDYMQSRFCRMTKKEVDKISAMMKKYREFVPSNVVDSFDGRYSHHLICLLDGIHKFNCIRNKTPELIEKEPSDADFLMLDEIFSSIIASWNIDMNYIKKIHPKARLNYLTSKAAEMYRQIEEDFKGKITDEKFEEIFSNDKSYVGELLAFEVVYKVSGAYCCHWREEVKGLGMWKSPYL